METEESVTPNLALVELRKWTIERAMEMVLASRDYVPVEDVLFIAAKLEAHLLRGDEQK